MTDVKTSKPVKQITDLNSLSRVVFEGALRFGGETLWWRGQACDNSEGWDLKPSIYRVENSHGKEGYLADRFRQRAGARHVKCPDPFDYAGWLFLMQHYHLPTRLLDWTESALVALFFVVADSSKHDKPGLLWGLSPMGLNGVESGEKLNYRADSDEVRHLFKEAFQRKKNNADKFKKVVAVRPDHHDIRHMVQLSEFTIHGTNTPLNEHEKASSFLVKYEVPAGAKNNLLNILDNLEITRSYLFPDLENLSKDLLTHNIRAFD